mmetsp:Transcript_4731/g.20233  ORF Transcript_4731/g.20233 Transcript_4731/m.20233 type:complete len:297 (-) Transcript_4731:281-1171(-)
MVSSSASAAKRSSCFSAACSARAMRAGTSSSGTRSFATLKSVRDASCRVSPLAVMTVPAWDASVTAVWPASTACLISAAVTPSIAHMCVAPARMSARTCLANASFWREVRTLLASRAAASSSSRRRRAVTSAAFTSSALRSSIAASVSRWSSLSLDSYEARRATSPPRISARWRCLWMRSAASFTPVVSLIRSKRRVYRLSASRRSSSFARSSATVSSACSRSWRSCFSSASPRSPATWLAISSRRRSRCTPCRTSSTCLSRCRCRRWRSLVRCAAARSPSALSPGMVTRTSSRVS